VTANLVEAVKRQGPLRVDRVEYVDPTVVFAGEAWSLAITCPWRLLRGESAVIHWDDPDVGDLVWDLVGHAVTEVRWRSPGRSNDPVLLMTGGYRLEIEADTDLDPWVFRLADLVYVGSR
jgi:hypothetical protein